MNKVYFGEQLVWENEVLWHQLFNGKLSPTFIKLDKFAKYKFVSGGEEIIKTDEDLGSGYMSIGQGTIYVNFSGDNLYVKSYGVAQEIQIYGVN